MARRADKIVVFGDLHGNWNAGDLTLLDQSEFDLALFVGDLGSGTLKNELATIRSIAGVRVPGLVLPGNNDAQFLAELSAELAYQSGATSLRSLAGLESAAYLEPCGYSNHLLATNGSQTTLITARPLAMGGSELSFATELARNFGVHSMRDSVARLEQLVEEASTDTVGFLAHNGPSGLGEASSDLWSRDFPLELADSDPPLDWGDTDLEHAIAHAKRRGKAVLFVVAGHMHRTEKTPRELSVFRDETLYVNVAATPRIVDDDDGERHHFVELRVFPDRTAPEQRVVVSERWVTV